MEDNLKKLFFYEKNLNGYKYVFHLSKYSDTQRIELSSRIQAVGGKVTFSFSSESIIVIDNVNELKSSSIKPHINKANLIIFMENKKIKYFFDEMLGEISKKFDSKYYKDMNIDDYLRFFTNHETVRKSKNETNIIKMQTKNEIDEYNFYSNEIRNHFVIYKLICFRDLIEILDEIEPFTIELQYRYGLPRNTDTAALISLVNFNESQGKKLNYHSFAKIKTNVKNKKKDLSNANNSDGKVAKKEKENLNILENYDFPFYDIKIQTGYSIFMTKHEKTILSDYLNKKKNKSSKEKLKNDQLMKNNLKSPEPRKDHNSCYVCNLRYEDYFEHIKSNLHIQSLIRNRENFYKLNEIFERIDGFWKEQGIKKSQLSLNKMSLGDEYSSMGMNLENINTTDSISNLTCGLIIENKGNDHKNISIKSPIKIEEKCNLLNNNIHSQTETNIQKEIKNLNQKYNKNKLEIFNKYIKKTQEEHLFKNDAPIDKIKIIINNNYTKNTSINFLNPLNKEISIPRNLVSNIIQNNDSDYYKINSYDLEFHINSSKTNVVNHNNIKFENQQPNDKSINDYNQEYKRILNTKNNFKKIVKDRPGFDYKLEKQIIPREENHIYPQKKIQKSNRSPKSNSINELSYKSSDFLEKPNYTGFKQLNILTKNNLIINDKLGDKNVNENISDKKNINDLLDCSKTNLYNDQEIKNVKIMTNQNLYKNKLSGPRHELLLKRNNLSGHSNNTSILNTSREIHEGNDCKDSNKNKTMKNLPSKISGISRDHSNQNNNDSLHSNDIINEIYENSHVNEKSNGIFNNTCISNSDKYNEKIEKFNPDSLIINYTSYKENRSKENKKFKRKKINEKYTIMEEKIIDEELNSRLSILKYRQQSNKNCNSPDYEINNLINMKEDSLTSNEFLDNFLMNNSPTRKNLYSDLKNEFKETNIFNFNENHTSNNNFEKISQYKMILNPVTINEPKILSSKSLVKIEIENDLNKEENEILNKKLETLTNKIDSISYEMKPILGNINQDLNYIYKEEDMMIEISNNENGSSGDTTKNYIINKIQDLYKTSRKDYSNRSFNLNKNEDNYYDILKDNQKVLQSSAGRNVNGDEDEYQKTPLNFTNSKLLEKQFVYDRKLKNDISEKNNKDENFNKKNSNILEITKNLNFDKFNVNNNNIFIRVSKKENIDKHLNDNNLTKHRQYSNSIKDDKIPFTTKLGESSVSDLFLNNLSKKLIKKIHSSDITFPPTNTFNSEQNNKVINEIDKNFFICKREIIFNHEKNSQRNENSQNLIKEFSQIKNDISNVTHKKCDSFIDVKQNLDLLNKNARQIIYKVSERNSKFMYSPTEHKQYIPKQTLNYEEKENFYNRGIGEKNINLIVSLSNNLRKDTSRNFGVKTKHSQWENPQSNNIASSSKVKNYEYKDWNRDTYFTKIENTKRLNVKNFDEINLSNQKQFMRELKFDKDKNLKKLKKNIDKKRNIIIKERKYKN